MSKSLYEILQVNENSSANDIKKSYRKLAKKYHPDINKSSDAEDKFKEINAAYEVLSDSKKKAQYDTHGDDMFGGQNFHDFAQNQGSNVDLDDILRNMFGGHGSPFGNMGGFANNSQRINLDIETQMTIALEIAVLGGTQTISLQHDSFDIKIPEGIKNGQKIRVKNKGKKSGNRRGDIIIKIIISNNKLYEIDDDDLIQIVNIPLKIALFGGKIDIKTIRKKITLRIPENLKQFQKFRVKNLGILNRKVKVIGDLYLKANIVLPLVESLDNDLAEHMEKKLPL